jgi:hypothetical protein
VSPENILSTISLKNRPRLQFKRLKTHGVVAGNARKAKACNYFRFPAHPESEIAEVISEIVRSIRFPAFSLSLPSISSAPPSRGGRSRGRGFEALFVLVDMSEVALWIDEGIRVSGPSLLQLGVLVGQVIERGV